MLDGRNEASARRDGAFRWKWRMGRHQAYHRSLANRIVHWLCIPLELAALVAAFACARAGRVDAATVLIVLLAPVYLATEPLAGACMVAFLAGCRVAFARVPWQGWPVAAAAVAAFALSFAVQVAIGHGIFERGRDDTRLNLAELRKSWNPVPLLLVPYYHLVEVLLAAGYRPALRREIDEHARREEGASRPG